MLVKEVMSKNPTFLPPTASLKEAGREMSKWGFGFLPIGSKEKDRLLGVLTDRDITIRATAEGKDPSKTQAQEVMTPKVWYCFEEDDVTIAIKSMAEKHVHRLIVLNKTKRLTGIISLSDIATKTHDAKLTGKLIESLSVKMPNETEH